MIVHDAAEFITLRIELDGIWVFAIKALELVVFHYLRIIVLHRDQIDQVLHPSRGCLASDHDSLR